MEAAQVIALARWSQQQGAPPQIRLEGSGPRSQVVALVASAVEPKLFSQVELHGGMHSLRYLVDKPITYEEAPDLFCLDLYKEFDIDRLVALAKPSQVVQHGYLELSMPAK
jgi:hypothetical protein